jgi:phenylacetate-CoA ligase
MYSHPDRRLIFSTFHITERNLAAYTRKLAQFQPRLIWGYPSAIYLLACFLENEKKYSIRPRAIVTSSETLLPFQRQKITQVFQTQLFNYYCNTERVANIMECERGKLHLRPEFGIVEFLDEQNRPVAPGQIGRMVATGLLNHAMPLLRYDIGDLAIPEAGCCACGRKSPLVKEIIGRVDDVLITADGRYVSRLGPVFHEIENIVEAQIIQNVKEKIVIRLVKKEAFSERDRNAILAKMTKIIGNATQVEFEFVREIPRLPNGKYKFVISNVKGEHWFDSNS